MILKQEPNALAWQDMLIEKESEILELLENIRKMKNILKLHLKVMEKNGCTEGYLHKKTKELV